ncbi:MAG TPA: hypothetical protein DEB09_05375 [Candidatus Magasanikbacteria bacterium]|nr:hypothetical protein [Candidatus Magasanikbacteria bacterium]
MRIAVIGQKGIPAIHGGVERHVHDLALRLAKNNQEVIVYARKWYTKKDQDFSFAGVLIKHLPSLHTKHFDAISHTLFSTLHAMVNKVDVIHYHGIGPSLLAWIPRLFSRHILVISTFHSIDRYDQKWNALAKMILRLAERCACTFPHKTITISKELKKYCLNEFYKETTYIPNGIESYKIDNTINKIAEFGLKKNEYLVMVSRLIPTKGAHILIEAFNNLKKNHSDNNLVKNLKLAIVGGSVYTNDYVKSLHQLGASNNDVIFTDFRSDQTLHQLYAHSLALVHPSFNEGLPLTVLEAMSFSKPVLATNIVEHQELINDKNFLFKENNVLDLETMLWKFLNMTKEEQRLAGKINKKKVEKQYHWDNIVPQIIEIYEEGERKNVLITAEAIS